MAAMKAPTGIVWLGHVPWDSSYRHVWYEGMIDKNQILTQFMTMNTNNYTYIRQDTNIRVPYNADTLYGINYCMYKNGDMWFCAFVNTITFLNNETSTLHLQEDIWHTWGEYAVFHPCLVDREHVSEDGLGQWRAPEPQMSLEESILSEQRFTELSFDTVVVGTNAIPHLKVNATGTIFTAHSETDFDGNEAVSGSFYNHIYSGLRYYAFTGSDRTALSNFLNNLNKAGAAESVACMFMVPSSLITIGTDHVVTDYGSTFPDRSYLAYRVSALGYTPRNKKCLTYPYCYFAVTDFNGGIMELKYEDCDTWGEVNLQFEQGLDATAALICTTKNYQGVPLDYHHSMVLAQNPQCAWVYEAFYNWMAQNSSTQQMKLNMNMVDIAIGLGLAGVGAFLVSTGAGAPAGGALGSFGLSAAEAAGFSALLGGLGKGAAGIRAESERKAQIESQKKVPNHISGQSSSNTLQGLDRNMGGYMRMGLNRKSAERLDAFFDVFGYAVDTVKVPNLTGRRAWNYVKTVGANLGGNIPADRLTAMNQRLDEGMTFWHNHDVGNYSLDNTLGE